MSLRSSVPRSTVAGIAWPATPGEIRLVVRRALTPDEEAAVIDRVDRNYGGGFRCAISYRDEIPRAAGGKYFVFRSELPA